MLENESFTPGRLNLWILTNHKVGLTWSIRMFSGFLNVSRTLGLNCEFHHWQFWPFEWFNQTFHLKVAITCAYRSKAVLFSSKVRKFKIFDAPPFSAWVSTHPELSFHSSSESNNHRSKYLSLLIFRQSLYKIFGEWHCFSTTASPKIPSRDKK